MTRQHEAVIETPAPAVEVWKAITQASEIQRWFAPEVRTDPRGGKGWRNRSATGPLRIPQHGGLG